jgi:nucleoside-diphosphate-sugar epimerase
MGMRVVVTGATGNVGTALLRRLADEPAVDHVVGVARRPPDDAAPETTWFAADLATDALDDALVGADAVVHLAWLFQPTRDPLTTWRANVGGTDRLLAAVERAGVPTFVHASSVGAYSPADAGGDGRPSADPVDESWPTHALPTAAYGREKSYVERILDSWECRHPDVRVVRMRPAFIFQPAAAVQQRRLFAGPFVPERLVRPVARTVLPDIRGFHLQALHADDAADAYARALTQPVRGAFNLAAPPVLDLPTLAHAWDAHLVRVPRAAARTLLAAAWRLHLTPAAAELFDLAWLAPVMATGRARTELGWQPRHDSLAAIGALLDGLADGGGGSTPPLARESSGPLRSHELATGVGARDD